MHDSVGWLYILGEPRAPWSSDLSRGLATPWDGISGPFLPSPPPLLSPLISLQILLFSKGLAATSGLKGTSWGRNHPRSEAQLS